MYSGLYILYLLGDFGDCDAPPFSRGRLPKYTKIIGIIACEISVDRPTFSSSQYWLHSEGYGCTLVAIASLVTMLLPWLPCLDIIHK